MPQAPKEQVDAWTKLVFDYLRGRATLKRVYVLIDSRHGIKKNDEEVLDLLDKAAVSYQIVLTKTDKIKPPAVTKTAGGDLGKDQEASGRLSGRHRYLVGKERGA